MPLSESLGSREFVDVDFALRTDGCVATGIRSDCEAAAAAAAALAAAPCEGSFGRKGGYGLAIKAERIAGGY